MDARRLIGGALRRELTWQTSLAIVGTSLVHTPYYLDPRPIPILRAELKRQFRLVRFPPRSVASVRTVELRGGEASLPARLYYPAEPSQYQESGEVNNRHPVVVFFHGGGWVVGDPDTHDNLARHLCNEAAAIVVSVDYRLAPEHPFPAAVDDALVAMRSVAELAGSWGGDPTRISVAGDSAGGNLAAVVCRLCQKRAGPPIAAQVLFYPALDLASHETDSFRQFGEGYVLDRKLVDWFLANYIPNRASRGSSMASPLHWKSFAHLPPALIITAGCDVLRDEAQVFAEKLLDSGVPTELHEYPGVIHGFAAYDGWFPEAKQALVLAGSFLRRNFARVAVAAESNPEVP